MSAFGASGVKGWDGPWTYHAVICPPQTSQRLAASLQEHWRSACPPVSALQMENKPNCNPLSAADVPPAPALLPGPALGLQLSYPIHHPHILTPAEAAWNNQQPPRQLVVEVACLSDTCSASNSTASEFTPPGQRGLPFSGYVIRVASPWGCPLECPR